MFKWNCGNGNAFHIENCVCDGEINHVADSTCLVRFAGQLLYRAENVLKPVLTMCVSGNSRAVRPLHRSATWKNKLNNHPSMLFAFLLFSNPYTWDFQKKIMVDHDVLCSVGVWHVHMWFSAFYETSGLLMHKHYIREISQIRMISDSRHKKNTLCRSS